ncbi:extracellular solute-binding protein [Butyrivibrio sp. YAB3001]|uniref:extracellular solute-binding protein n=1 Tax=Butyrivibrio sp. YAB3001 TaxID=1520812 RepID=UPI0008F63482|nr:extracellular solute-binding protein [Butyrivibrio sp. YAB3001]SFB75899.1 iron(III) transport system substrate-binding protein [Butyrivibrio sp. YAB3001]
MKKVMTVLPIILVIAVFAVFWGVSVNTRNDSDPDDNSLVVVSPNPIEFMTPLMQEFENETGISVNLISCGTTDAIEKITTDEDVDVLWGGSLLAVGSYKDYFFSYKTLNRAIFKEQFKTVEGEFTCFSDVPSVIIVNSDIIGDIKVEGYDDLLNPLLKGQIAYANPLKSSSAFEHLVNMLYAMGKGDPENGWDYVKKLINNLDGKLLDNSSEVYYGVADGKFKVGLTFEEAAVTMIKKDKHIRIVYMDEGVLSTPDGIYISKKSKRISNAERFVDFLTSKDAQLYMASDLGRRSVRKDVEGSKLVISSDEIPYIGTDKFRVMNSKNKWIEKFLQRFEEVNP